MKLMVVATAVFGVLSAQPAWACGDPPKRWYSDVSQFVFDGVADCDLEKRFCRVRVTNVLKSVDSLSLERRTIEVDFQDWFADWQKTNPDEIVITCGVPVFEPEQSRFRARFYANINPLTEELIVRKAWISGKPFHNHE